MWESLRGYVCALLAGAIFVACQALSGGAPGGRADGAGVEPGDRSYRAETMGRSRADRAPLTATSLYAESSTGVQTD